MSRKHNFKSRSRLIAMGGLFTALAVIVMLAGGILPIATFSAPILASLCLLPVLIELGTKAALLAYLAVALLSLLLVSDKELVLFFIMMAGYYPIIQPYLHKIKSKPFKLLIKLLIFNLTTLAVYWILLALFANPALINEFSASPKWFWGILLAAGNVTFLLYDVLIGRVRLIYIHHWRKYLFR